jgi:hypothetical protein
VSLVAVAALTTVSAAGALAGDRAALAHDFIGDGRRDLATGARSWMDAASGRGGGAVIVLPGSRRGARLAARRSFARPLAGVPGDPPIPVSFGPR